MTYMTHFAIIAGIILLACMSPGPNFILVSSYALITRRTGLFAAFGVTTAAFAWALLGVVGLGLVLARVAWLYEVIRVVGAGYLIYLGLKMLWGVRRGRLASHIEPQSGDASNWVAWRRGFLTSMTNPKAAAFAASFYVAALPMDAPAWVYVTTVAIVVTVSGTWHCALALLFSTGSVRTVYRRGRRTVDAVMGTVLVVLGGRLVLSP